MSEGRRGVLFGVAAYLLWGLFPLYWPLLEPAGAPEILAHRIVWSLVAVLALLAAQRGLGSVRGLGRRRLGLLGAASVVLALNWLTYIHGVNSGQVIQTSLGYFTNPLVTILLGVVVLGERLRRAQWVAVGFAAVAVAVLTVDYGGLPMIALTLAFSFAAYGLLKKKAAVDAVPSLTVETLMLTPGAVICLAVLAARGQSTFGGSPGHAVLLALTGVVTAVPLLFFGAAANRVPLSTIGLLQYLAPVIQFLIGVLVFHEDMPASRVAGFALVWIALVLLTVDGVRQHRRQGPAGPDPLEAHEVADVVPVRAAGAR